MKLARYTVGTHSRLVTLREFFELEGKSDRQTIGPNGQKGWSVQPTCPDCGQPVHTYDTKGAKGFRVASREVSHPRAHIGFHHFDRQAGLNCPSSYANDPRFAGLYHDNTFTPRERDRNRDVLTTPAMQRANGKVLAFLMRRLTGSDIISEANQQAIDRLTKYHLYPMAGLSQHPWLLPFMQVLLVGVQQRTFKGTRLRNVAYDQVGGDLLDFRDVDNNERKMRIPHALRLCFSNKTGRKLQPMEKNGHPILFEISRAFAIGIIKPSSRSHTVNRQPNPSQAFTSSSVQISTPTTTSAASPITPVAQPKTTTVATSAIQPVLPLPMAAVEDSKNTITSDRIKAARPRTPHAQRRKKNADSQTTIRF